MISFDAVPCSVIGFLLRILLFLGFTLLVLRAGLM
jgi:hypothetical protein